MKFCKDCIYYKTDLFCNAPQNGINLTTGESRHRIASISREFDCGCGKEAKWFVPTPIIIKKLPWWKKLWKN